MRVSYICHETKVCAPHLIYQTGKKLECSAQMQKPTFPFSFTLSFSGFSGHCTTTRVSVFVCHIGGSDCGYITTIKIRHCVAVPLLYQSQGL